MFQWLLKYALRGTVLNSENIPALMCIVIKWWAESVGIFIFPNDFYLFSVYFLIILNTFMHFFFFHPFVHHIAIEYLPY